MSINIALLMVVICWLIVLIIIDKLYRDAGLRSQILKVGVSFFLTLLGIFYLTQNLSIFNKYSPPSLSPSAPSKILEIFETLPKGLFVYSCSKEMTLGIPETCTARIANYKYLLNFRDSINKGLTPQNLEDIELQYVSSIMSVKLIGKNFDIEPKANEEIQVIEDKSFSSWQWDVTPTETGMQKLDFIVSVILSVPGYEKLPPKRFEANTLEVNVNVNPSFSMKIFMKHNWKYLITLIFVLLYLRVTWLIKSQKIEAIMVNEGDTYNIGQAGAVGKFASSHKNTFVQSDQKVTLAEAATEIQKLLKQLEINNPEATEREKIAYVNVATNPDIKKRAIAALKAGGETAIEEFLANPYINVGKAIIKSWIKPE